MAPRSSLAPAGRPFTRGWLVAAAAGCGGLAAAAGCGWLPADAPPQAPATADPDIGALAHAWRVDAHVLAKYTAMSDADAAELHDRPVAITVDSYTTPWHGTCQEASLTRRQRPLAEVAAELAVDRGRITGLGLADPLVEYKLSCQDLQKRTPALILYVTNERALTCFSGVCYRLVHPPGK